MQASVEPNGPHLAVVPSNPVPEGARVGFFDTTDRIRLRYALFPRAAGSPMRGTVCLVHGRTEFIEKYFETIADFQSRGFAVATFDWRGQGGSQRLIRNPQLGHVRRFADYFTDLSSFHRAILLPDCDAHYAQIIAEKIRAAVAAYRLRWGLHRTRVKASVGVVQIQPTLSTVDAVLGGASLACTEAKAVGGDSVRVFVPAGGYEELAG